MRSNLRTELTITFLLWMGNRVFLTITLLLFMGNTISLWLLMDNTVSLIVTWIGWCLIREIELVKGVPGEYELVFQWRLFSLDMILLIRFVDLRIDRERGEMYLAGGWIILWTGIINKVLDLKLEDMMKQIYLFGGSAECRFLLVEDMINCLFCKVNPSIHFQEVSLFESGQSHQQSQNTPRQNTQTQCELPSFYIISKKNWLFI